MAITLIHIPSNITDFLRLLGIYGPPFTAAFARPTFASLVASKGFTFATLAGLVGVEPVLLERIDQKRQPMPMLLAMNIASKLGVQVGEVIGAVGLVTESTHPLNFVALPPRPELGDTIPTIVTAKTADVLLPTPPAPPPGLWVVGPGLSGVSAGMAFLNRLNSVLVSNVPLPSVSSPAFVTKDNSGMLWTFGRVDGGAGFFNAKVDPVLGQAVLSVTSASYNQPFASACDSVSGTVWAGNSAGTTIVAMNLTTGATTASLTLTDGINNFSPRGMLATGGFLYVLGERGAGTEGRIFKVNPVGPSITAVSTGVNLGAVRSIAYDGTTNLYVTSNPATVHRVPIATLVAPAAWHDVAAANPNVQQLRSVHYAFAHVWVSALEVSGGNNGQRLCKITPGATQAATRVFTATGVSELGTFADDGTYLWFSDPTGGNVHKLDPASIAASLTTTPTGGTPIGMVVTA